MRHELGNTLHQIRLDRTETLKDMAGKIKVTPAFISNIEHGRKEPPSGFDSRIEDAYSLHSDEVSQLRRTYAIAKKSFQISSADPDRREVVAMFARTLPKINSEQLAELKKLIQDHGED